MIIIWFVCVIFETFYWACLGWSIAIVQPGNEIYLFLLFIYLCTT